MEQSVFKDAKFFIISCNHKEVVDLLKSLGAVSHPFLSESVRFAISDDPSLAEVGEAEELYAVPVVTSHWVKLSVEAQKFLPFRPFHPDFKHIFAGTVITCSGLSVADQLSIWAHVTIHGGQMCHYLDKSVTHVVVAKAAGNFYKYCTNKLANDNDACDENNSKPFIVTPDWVVDCLSQNNLLPCTSYHPDLLVCTTSLSSPSKQTCLKKPQQQLNEPKELDLCHANSSINDSIKEENNLIINSALANDSVIHGNNNNIVVEVIGTTTLTSNANITATTNSNIVNRTNTSQLPPPIPPPQQQQSQIHTSKQYLVQTNQLMHHTLQSTHQLSTVLSGGTNVQAATGISVQQINMRNVDQKSQFGSGLSPIPPNKPGRGGHSRGGSGSGSGRGSSKKASQDQFRSGSQQQQQRRFSLSPPVPNRYPVAPNVGAVSGGGGISSHRFALNRPQGAVAQRYPSTSPIYTDPAVQQGLMQQTGGSDAHGNPISLGTNYSTSSVSTNHTNVILTNSLLPTTTSTTTLGGHSVIGSNSGGGGSNTITLTTSLTATTGVNALNNITGNSGGGGSNSGGGASSVSTTTTTSTTTTGHHGKTSKSKSSKHMQEQNLNEEEKDAIVMQNVKNILSLQHTWNRESSHGRGSSEAHSSNSNTGHNQNGPNSFSGPQGGNPSNLSNLINSSYGSSSNLTNSQISGSHRKPKSPKSPCRAVGSNLGHKVSPKSPKNAKVTGVTKTLASPHQQHIQQQQQQPSIVMAGCAGSALPSVLLTGNLQQMQYRPANGNSLQPTPSQLQRSTSMQHYLTTTATIASHQPQSSVQGGTSAYIVQRHPCGQLVASVPQQTTHGQLHTQSFPVQNPYQRAGSILNAVNNSTLAQQQQTQPQVNVQHFQHTVQQPTLLVRTTRQPYQQNDNMESQSDVTIISSDGCGDILLSSNHVNPQHPLSSSHHQIPTSHTIQPSNHLFQSNHQPGHNSTSIEQTPHNKQSVNSQSSLSSSSSPSITQQLLLQSPGGSNVGVGNPAGQLIQIKSTPYSSSPVQQALLSESNQHPPPHHHYQQQQHSQQHHLATLAPTTVNSNSQLTPTMIIDNRTLHHNQSQHQVIQPNCSLATTSSTHQQQPHHQQQAVQLHFALQSPTNNVSNNNTLGNSGSVINANQVKSPSTSNILSQQHSTIPSGGGKMTQLQQQIQTPQSPTRHSVNNQLNRHYVQQPHQFSAALTPHPTHYQQQQQQQKVQLSPATAAAVPVGGGGVGTPPQYQTIHGCFTPQPQQQHPQQIIFQSPTGQQIIAAPQHQSMSNTFGRSFTNSTPSGGMLLRSVLPCPNNTNNTLGNGFHQNQSSSLVTLTTNQRAVSQITNRAPANKVLFQTSPTAQVNTSNNNNNAVHSSQQQGVHQHHHQQQQQQPIHTPQQIHPNGIISSQQLKTNHQIVHGQSVGRGNAQMVMGDSSSVNVINAQNHPHQTGTVHSPYHHVAGQHLVHNNNVDHSFSPRPTHHSQVAQMPSNNHSSSTVNVANGQPPRHTSQIPVTTIVQSVNRQISCNSTSVNVSHSTPTIITPVISLTPTYYGHDGNPLPSKPEECLIGCVLLILGYRNVPESQKIVWRRVMRSHGAEVVMAYDPTKVTHVVIDCQLEEPDVIKQALLDQKRLVTIYWVNDILAKGRMIAPFEILHLPSPFSKDITFSFIRTQIISLTGFEGKDRQKIEMIIRQIGATFTDYLEPTNTLLVCKQPSGKKYEMAQLWDIPCINVRWLQDLYFGDLTTLSLPILHKYLCFETSDVTISLERCTPRVQDLMVGWQNPIRLTQEIWIRSTKLSHDFANEERERKRKLELETNMNYNDNSNNHCKVKKSRCLLTSLTDEEIKIAMSCRPRYEILLLEAEQKRELQATMKAIAASAAAAAASDPQSTPESETNLHISAAAAIVAATTITVSPVTANTTITTTTTADSNNNSDIADCINSTPNISVSTVNNDKDNVDTMSRTNSAILHLSNNNHNIVVVNDQPNHQSCSVDCVEISNLVCEENNSLIIKMECDNHVSSIVNESNDNNNIISNDNNNTDSVTQQQQTTEESNYLKHEECKKIKEESEVMPQNTTLTDQSDSDYSRLLDENKSLESDPSKAEKIVCCSESSIVTSESVSTSENIPSSSNHDNNVSGVAANDDGPIVSIHNDVKNDNNMKFDCNVVTCKMNTNKNSIRMTSESDDIGDRDEIESTEKTSNNEAYKDTDNSGNNDSDISDTVPQVDGIAIVSSSTSISKDCLFDETKVSQTSVVTVNANTMESCISENSSVTVQKDTDIVMTDELNIVSSDNVTTTTTDSMIVKDLHDNIIQSNNINNTTESLTIETTIFTGDNVSSVIQPSHLCDDDAVRKRLATSPIDDMMMDSKRRAMETNSVDPSSKITNITDYCPVTSFSSQHTPPSSLSSSSPSTCRYESKTTEKVSNSVLNGHIKLDAENSVIMPIIKIDEKLNGVEEDISESSSHMDDDTIDNIVVEEVVQNINDNNNDITDTVCSKDTISKNQSTNHHHDTTVLPPPICTEIRITFTAIDLESRLSLTELCLQLPDCKIVDSAEEATHLVANRLIRTPKTYMAVALGCYVVTPKWIQASVMCGYWIDETPWILSDPDSETQLGIDLKKSISIARKRQMIGPEAGLFAGLEFWFSPGACHREMCIALIKAGHGIIRQRRPTQKMALLVQPKQLIICHEDDSHVANYLMRTKTGNKAVHHEEFILSGTLRQELDFDAYQIQYVNTLRNSLKAAVAAAAAATALSNNNNIKNGNNNNSNASVTILPPPTSLRFDNHSSNNNTMVDTQNILSSFGGLIPRCQTDSLINNQQIHLSSSSTIQNPSSQQSNHPSTTSHQIVVSSSSMTKNTSSMSNDKFIQPTIATCSDVDNTHISTHSYVGLSSYKPSTNIQSLSNSHLQLTCSSDISCQSIINNTTCLVSKITKADTNLSYLLSRSNTLDQVSIKNNLTCSFECDITNTLSTSFPSLSSSSGSMLLSSTISPSISSHQDFNDIQLDGTIGASNKLISDLIISVCNVNTCSTIDSLNTNDKNNSIMLPPKPSVTAYIASFDNKRLIIGNNRSTNNSLLLNCTNPTVFDTFLSNQETKPNALHRSVTPLTAMIVAAESVVGDLINPLSIYDTNNIPVCSIQSTFIISKPSGFLSQFSNVTGTITSNSNSNNNSNSSNNNNSSSSSTVNLNARIAAADANAVASATAAAASALNSSNHSAGVIVVSANSGCGNNNINDSSAEITNKTGIGLTVSTPVIIVGVGSDSGLGIPIRSSSSSSRGNILTANNAYPSSELIDSSRNLLFNVQQQPVSSSSVAFTTSSSPTKLSLTIESLDVVKNLIKNQTDFKVNNSLVDNITISIDNTGNNNANSNDNNNNSTTTDSSLIFQSSMPLQQSSHKLISSSIPVNTTHDNCDNNVGDAVSLPYSFSLSSSLPSDFALIHHNTAITTTHNIVLENTSNYFVVQPLSSLTSATTTLSSSMPVSYTSNLIHCLDKEHSSISTDSNNNNLYSEIPNSHIENNNNSSFMTTSSTAANTTTLCNITSDSNTVVMTTPLTESYYPNIMNKDNINCSNNDTVCTIQSTTLNIQTSSNSTFSFCSLPCSIPSSTSTTTTATL
ncbi:unnamed protein product [Schistosoma rodhaini]|uniref:BRCT domain-containing protein n=1 Tax=Schistosoma rodhaini TaxID=6188 RepID=A0AA85FR91_9TREM|nr:unnamed protein product [Schistosoma rodhaini]